MNYILIICGIILYLFVGGFIAGLTDNSDGESIIISMLVWPLMLLFAITGVVSASLGEWTRKQLEDFWESLRSR